MSGILQLSIFPFVQPMLFTKSHNFGNHLLLSRLHFLFIANQIFIFHYLVEMAGLEPASKTLQEVATTLIFAV